MERTENADAKGRLAAAGYTAMRGALSRAGYREHEVTSERNADTMYQKVVRDDHGMRYSIEAYLWDFSVHRGAPPLAAGATFEATMYRDDETFTITVRDPYSVFSAKSDLDEAWSKLRTVYDPHND